MCYYRFRRPAWSEGAYCSWTTSWSPGPAARPFRTAATAARTAATGTAAVATCWGAPWAPSAASNGRVLACCWGWTRSFEAPIVVTPSACRAAAPTLSAATSPWLATPSGVRSAAFWRSD